MSTVTRIMLEAEAASGREAMRAAMREERLRAAMQAAARQADSRRGLVHQEPGPGSRRPDPRVVDPDPHVAGSTQVGGDLITNNTPGRWSRPAKPIQSGKSKIVT